MDVVVYPGPQQSAVAALQAHLASRKGMRVASQSWVGDNLMVVYDFDDPRSTVAKSIVAILAALALGIAGLQMISLHSIGGNSVAEPVRQRGWSHVHRTRSARRLCAAA